MKSFLMLFALFLSNCSPYPDLSKLAPDERFETLAAEPGLRVESRALDAPESYSAVVAWKLDAEIHEELYLYRTEAGQRVFLGVVDSHEGHRLDETLKSDTQYSYEIVAADGGVIHQQDLRTARDLVVRGVLRLPQDYVSISRLFFEPNAVLITEGVDVKWSLSEVRGAPGARLVSFLTEAPASENEPARSSGNAQIFARRASSTLQVEWRGQSGFHGARGRANPESGSRGRDGSGGGLVGRHGNCRRGSNGENGGRGPEGFPGKPGGNGGDAESFELSVLYPSEDFVVYSVIEAGAAGRGGAGGAGGPGGRGGQGGHGTVDCSSGSSGSAGASGRTGPRGRDGEPGEVLGDVCVRSAGDTSCSNVRHGLKSAG